MTITETPAITDPTTAQLLEVAKHLVAPLHAIHSLRVEVEFAESELDWHRCDMAVATVENSIAEIVEHLAAISDTARDRRATKPIAA